MKKDSDNDEVWNGMNAATGGIYNAAANAILASAWHYCPTSCVAFCQPRWPLWTINRGTTIRRSPTRLLQQLLTYWLPRSHTTHDTCCQTLWSIVVPYVFNVAYCPLMVKYAYFNVFYKWLERTEQLWDFSFEYLYITYFILFSLDIETSIEQNI